MEPPVSIQSESVRDEKLKVLKSLAILFLAENIAIDSVRAQYLPTAYLKGEAACSYLDEDGVDEAK